MKFKSNQKEDKEDDTVGLFLVLVLACFVCDVLTSFLIDFIFR